MKRLIVIFVSAFVLNALWENLHSVLYTSYQGSPITEFILLRASLFDALMITIILLPFIYLRTLKGRELLIVPVGIVVAVINEWYGLSTARWEYNSLMPIIPLIGVGLSPAIQLGILGYLTYALQRHIIGHTSAPLE